MAEPTQPAGKRAEPWESCSGCRDLPAVHGASFLEAGRADVPPEYLALRGWEGKNLSSGYQKFRVHCPRCMTEFLVEIDVEPFVWDLSVTRLAGRAKDYRGLYG